MRSEMKYVFEELPDFWDDGFRSGLHDGWAEISYVMQEIEGAVGVDTWKVDHIVIDCPNGKCGAAAARKLVRLGDGYLLTAMKNILETKYADKIEDAIREIEEH